MLNRDRNRALRRAGRTWLFRFFFDHHVSLICPRCVSVRAYEEDSGMGKYPIAAKGQIDADQGKATFIGDPQPPI